MELTVVNFKQAKGLEELGFPQNLPIKQYYNSKMPAVNPLYEQITGEIVEDEVVSAPELELVVKWLRDEKHFYLSIEYDSNFRKWNCFYSGTDIPYGDVKNELDYFWDSYDEMLSASIDLAIRLLKDDENQ